LHSIDHPCRVVAQIPNSYIHVRQRSTMPRMRVRGNVTLT
jgi:hypothetical protein